MCSLFFINFLVFHQMITRLWHQKRKGLRQSHALSQNSEAIDVSKVACQPPSRHVVVCDDYSFKSTMVSLLLQWDVRTIIKLKLKQASKEYQKVSPQKNMRKASQNVFHVYITISQSSRGCKASLEWFWQMKYCF